MPKNYVIVFNNSTLMSEFAGGFTETIANSAFKLRLGWGYYILERVQVQIG